MIHKFLHQDEECDTTKTPEPEHSGKERQRMVIPHRIFLQCVTRPSDPESRKHWKFRKSALVALHRHAEAYIGRLLLGSKQYAQQEGRVTIQLSDFVSVLEQDK